MQIFIPAILQYKCEKLTEENLKNFEKMIYSGLGSNFTRIDANNKLQYVTFYWGDSDYPDYIKIKLNEYFLYNLEDENIYIITKELNNDWIIIGENDNEN